MTDTETKLCRDIAGLERPGLTIVTNSVGLFWKTLHNPPHLTQVPRYLTDPSEQMRMQEKIIEEYGSIHIYTEFLGEYRDRKAIAVRMGDKKGEENTYIGKNTPVAIAEAYKAMLEN